MIAGAYTGSMLAGLLVLNSGSSTPTLAVDLSDGVKHYIKTNDTNRYLYDEIKHEGVAVDLTECSVVLLMTDEDTVSIRQDATVLDAVLGTVAYYPGATDFEVSGHYRVEWEVTFPNGLVATFPDINYRKLTLVQDLG